MNSWINWARAALTMLLTFLLIGPATAGLKEIRERGELRHLRDTPLMILSSGPLKDDAERARALNLRGFLSKPLTDTELLAAIRRALGVAETGATAPPSATPQPTHSSDKLVVLLVEDNAINQQLAIRLLEKWGHQVTLAVHGQEAVERLREEQTCR